MLLCAFVLAGGFFSRKLFLTDTNEPKENKDSTQVYPELQDLAERQRNFEELQTYFKDLARTKDARYAFDVLMRAPAQANIDMHLLGHVVGDELYIQEGMNGITACTNDFRNACSHAIVTGLFFDKGTGALGEIAQTCRNAPGGKGAYTMCFHGLGHGILAYHQYDMAKAVEDCKKTSTPAFNNREGVECIGGTIMEIIGGGFHDRDAWSLARPKYLQADSPLSLCAASDLVPKEAKQVCFVYLTPYLFQTAGADLGSPTPENFKKAFTFCNALPASDAPSRDACYGGFGKEFTVLARDRDIRQNSVENITDEQLAKVNEWCQLADSKEGGGACIVHAVNSLYWGGENNRTGAVRFCKLISDSYFQNTCMYNLITSVSFYIDDKNYRTDFCMDLPETYQSDCRQRLNLN